MIKSIKEKFNVVVTSAIGCIGKKKEKYPDVFIDNWEVTKTEENSSIILNDEYEGKINIYTVPHQVYLGEIISFDGSNTKDIQSKVSKLQGLINNIMQILYGTYFGDCHFEF